MDGFDCVVVGAGVVGLAAARPRMASSLPASSSFVATISLPQRAWGTPRSRQ